MQHCWQGLFPAALLRPPKIDPRIAHMEYVGADFVLCNSQQDATIRVLRGPVSIQAHIVEVWGSIGITSWLYLGRGDGAGLGRGPPVFRVQMPP